MFTRREAISLIGSASVAMWLDPVAASEAGGPMSPARLALIEAFRKRSEGLDRKFEARSYKSDWTMPYRLFRPRATGKLPLVMYLHGSGGVGDDNEKQLGLGNVFGTRVWLLPENQKRFPCYVLAPQTDRGWIAASPGLGDGARLAMEIIDRLRGQFSIDERRIYVTGQSLGGGGAWNALTYRPNLFAAAVICCGSPSADDGTGAIAMPLWNFHGDADKAVPVSVSRDRIAARRKAGGHPLSTEYAGVEHDVWRWAYTEPELVKWMFAQHR